ncbi:antitoxin VbhA family protein [Hymenobacter sp. BT559]|uniref:antitoxin VbhA family protein n=1 Tax=Hymenobacter sp. BT559 TaxID=2795729 RepID=UPI0018ED0775|nr:antitoxin VbhA family protein [Hymenobacter sp. BT559]MBJ6144183.1 antitoxin VbhA family protein [Hymenobacter sp. BT559]
MKSKLSQRPAILTNTLAARRREVENALLVQALCGRKPSPAVQAQLRRYEAGELPRELAFAGLYAGHQQALGQ